MQSCILSLREVQVLSYQRTFWIPDTFFVEQESVVDMDEVDEAAAPVRIFSHFGSEIESSPHHFLSFSHPRW